MTKKNLFTAFLFAACTILIQSCGKHGEADHHDHDMETETSEHDHEHDASEGLVLEPEKAKEFGIEFETVAPAPFSHVIKTSGSIEAPNSDYLTATAKKSGIITLAPGLTVGAVIKNGAHIGSISSAGVQGSDIPQATNINLSALKAEYERLKPLYEDGLVTASVFNEAERAYKEAQAFKEAQAIAGTNVKAGSSTVVSPAEGSIQNLFVNSGDYVEVGAPVATIAKNTNQILKADLPSREASHLAELRTANFIPEGADYVLKLTDLNGRKISGASGAAISNGYMPVYFSFSGNALSSPGGYAEVFLICGDRENVISVPREALIEIQGNKYIYVAKNEHAYEKKLVKTGSSDGSRVEIIEGLNSGDKIVAKGASIMRMAEVSAVAPPSHSHNH